MSRPGRGPARWTQGASAFEGRCSGLYAGMQGMQSRLSRAEKRASSSVGERRDRDRREKERESPFLTSRRVF